MIYKNINKFINLLFTISLLYSCQSIDLLKKKEVYIQEYNDIYENNFSIDINNNYKKNFDNNDYFSPFFINNWNSDREFIKINKIDFYGNKLETIRPLSPIIYNDNLLVITDYASIGFYDKKNFVLKYTIDLDLESNLNDNETYPISFTKFNDKLFISYSDGLLISINFEGKIIWKIQFNDIIKTPIKIFNSNIIIMLTDRLISINPKKGDINWEFIYENDTNNLLNSNGGEIVNLNHLLFFILPNFQIGEIDTIFGEKNDNIISNFNLDDSLKNLTKKIHTYKNLLSFFDNNKFINTIDVNSNSFLLKNIKIENVSSSSFFNNSLFTLNKDGYLRSYNIINKNIFWKANIIDYVDYNDKIINVTSFNNTLLILFSNGIFIQFNANDGKIISHKNFKIKNITYINTYKDLIFILDNEFQIHIFSL